MHFRRSHLSLLIASSLLVACADAPTSPPLAPSADAQSGEAFAKGGNRPGARLTAAVDETVNGADIEGTIRITGLQHDPATGRLTALGVLSGTANGQAFTQAFSNVLATLSRGPAAAVATDGEVAAFQAGSCDILFLDLGPLHLDLLGLEVDLSQVVLDIDAQAGAGNLLGNLLCAVVSLLDGPGLLASIAGILEQINAILDAF